MRNLPQYVSLFVLVIACAAPAQTVAEPIPVTLTSTIVPTIPVLSMTGAVTSSVSLIRAARKKIDSSDYHLNVAIKIFCPAIDLVYAKCIPVVLSEVQKKDASVRMASAAQDANEAYKITRQILTSPVRATVSMATIRILEQDASTLRAASYGFTSIVDYLRGTIPPYMGWETAARMQSFRLKELSTRYKGLEK